MDTGKSYCLSIAGITILVESDQPHAADSGFIPFLVDCKNPDIRITFRQAEQLPSFSEQILHEDLCYRVHPDGKGGYIRAFFDAPRDMTPYAIGTYDYENRKILVDYLEKGAHCVSQMHNSFFHLGFESLLIHENRLCIHAACVRTPLGGILFSGRSGIGKSTQADLWCRYRDAKLINGDRPILSKSEDGWLAWGSPYAGSSRCHINENCPVRAIVMLRQEKECTLRRLNPSEAFRAVWSGLTMNSWNESMVAGAADMAAQLIETVPIFEFGCTPDEQAVNYLERELRKEWK